MAGYDEEDRTKNPYYDPRFPNSLLPGESWTDPGPGAVWRNGRYTPLGTVTLTPGWNGNTWTDPTKTPAEPIGVAPDQDGAEGLPYPTASTPLPVTERGGQMFLANAQGEPVVSAADYLAAQRKQ